ncbi:MAG: BON domain-containing protein [Woeseiaceae bacterium]
MRRSVFTLRPWMLAGFAVALSGCTAMLLGGGNSDGTSLGGARSSGQTSADGAITTAVRRRLVDDPVLAQYNLRIETVNQRVTLHGAVGSYEARERAIRLAGSVEGVERVDSRIRVDSGY